MFSRSIHAEANALPPEDGCPLHSRSFRSEEEMEARPQPVPSRVSVSLKDVVVSFTREEWDQLDSLQRTLYRDVTLETCSHLVSLGLLLPNLDVMSRLEQGEDPWSSEWAPPPRGSGSSGCPCRPGLGPTAGCPLLLCARRSHEFYMVPQCES
ncbi:zinc finger protein 544 isoform X2 [Saccopteryx leptura]|uniref:zinc finger protein 544 isoform X2 n=1 Tax=Saccopteryx leptura TaxID=249018 RepID=UPI00339C3631